MKPWPGAASWVKPLSFPAHIVLLHHLGPAGSQQCGVPLFILSCPPPGSGEEGGDRRAPSIGFPSTLLRAGIHPALFQSVFEFAERTSRAPFPLWPQLQSTEHGEYRGADFPKLPVPPHFLVPTIWDPPLHPLN